MGTGGKVGKEVDSSPCLIMKQPRPRPRPEEGRRGNCVLHCLPPLYPPSPALVSVSGGGASINQ